MFRLMRNTHLALGVAFFFVAMLFALSSVVIIYRPFFPGGPERTNRTVTLAPGLEGRAVALELMRSHGAKGDLRDLKVAEGEIQFGIWRPGTHMNVKYSSASGVTTLDERRFNIYETLVQLHVNHGFWHDFLPANLWSLLSLGVSVGLLLLGASGIYLWYKHPQERTIGNILLALGFAIPLVALAITRLQGN
jgi:hypothetical protein